MPALRQELDESRAILGNFAAAAARFVNAVKEYLENPLLLLMDA